MSTPDRSLRVGVLSFHNSKETKALCNAVSDLGHEPVWLRETNLDFRVERGRAEVSPHVDVVINRLLLSNINAPLEDLEIANVLDALRPVVNPPHAVLTALHKFATAARLAETGVPIPESYMALTGPRLEEGTDHFGGAVIQKTGVGTHGATVQQLDDDQPIAPRIGTKRTFLQRYLDQEDIQSDLRVYVVGDRVIGAMKRTTPEGDWRANIARGGTATDMSDTLPEPAHAVAVDAAAALGLDVAGVDLMRYDGEWVVIEVNPTAGFKGFFDATGVSPAPHIVREAVERVGGEVSENRVAELSTGLDDSVPDCKPSGTESGGTQPTIGYTEDVVVNGQEWTATVEAKADTGAARTSIGIDLASEVGAGPIRSSTEVRSGSRKSSKTRPLVDVDVAVRDQWYTVTASVEDRSHMNFQVLLGRDLLTRFKLDLSADDEGVGSGEE